jgi:predicted RNA-binding Zn ribbon-like protein
MAISSSNLPAPVEPQRDFDLSGGRLCLDLANAVGRTYFPASVRIERYPDLIAWSVQAGTIAPEVARRLLARAEADPAGAGRELARARALGSAIYGVFSAIAAGEPAPPADLATLAGALAAALGKLKLEPATERYDWDWSGDEDDLDRPLAPVAVSAVDLLRQDALRDVRECGGVDCQWLFVDSTRNHSRRWCDMQSCGNRAKARRHYARMRTGAA